MTSMTLARARTLGLVCSVVAVLVSLGFGFTARRAWALREEPELYPWLLGALILLLVVLLFRMVAALCELYWLERTWSALPLALCRVGPVKDVQPFLAVVLSLVPGVAWLWKLGLAHAMADAFETLRQNGHVASEVPRRLGTIAVVTGWIPGLNVYVAPFVWEAFATRVDAARDELAAALPAPQGGPVRPGAPALRTPRPGTAP